MATDNFITGDPANAAYQALARTMRYDGTRTFQLPQDAASGILVDEHGRLLTRQVSSEVGFDYPGAGETPHPYAVLNAGSAPEYDGVGLVQQHRVMQSPSDEGSPNNSGRQTILRTFGYCAAAGWVQFILRDESGGANPPVLGNIPEITIAVGANQNFVFGQWQLVQSSLGPARADLATYIAFSTTGPTFTPGGANLWFSFFGFL